MLHIGNDESFESILFHRQLDSLAEQGFVVQFNDNIKTDSVDIRIMKGNDRRYTSVQRTQLSQESFIAELRKAIGDAINQFPE